MTCLLPPTLFVYLLLLDFLSRKWRVDLSLPVFLSPKGCVYLSSPFLCVSQVMCISIVTRFLSPTLFVFQSLPVFCLPCNLCIYVTGSFCLPGDLCICRHQFFHLTCNLYFCRFLGILSPTWYIHIYLSFSSSFCLIRDLYISHFLFFFFFFFLGGGGGGVSHVICISVISGHLLYPSDVVKYVFVRSYVSLRCR